MKLLPALVLGIETPIGLTMIRELGEHGVAVHGIARSPTAIGRASRYLRSVCYRPASESELIALLLETADRLGPCVLMAAGESDILLLNRHRDRLTKFHLAIPAPAQMSIALDKALSCAQAEAVGIRTPRSLTPGSLEELLAAIDELQFPVVLKWPNPHAVQAQLAQAGLALDKLHYCHDREALIRYLKPYLARGLSPCIQEYARGVGLGHFVLLHRGEPVRTFQHRRLNEWPPEGGTSSLCISLSKDAHAALMAKSIALLQGIGWEGPAMVEYRWDPQTDTAVFMEINGRFWGSLALAWHAGAEFVWSSYALAAGLKVPTQTPPRAGIRCKYMVPDSKRLLRILFQSDQIQDRSLRFNKTQELANFLLDFFRCRYFVFSLRDPLPFFFDLYCALRKKLRR